MYAIKSAIVQQQDQLQDSRPFLQAEFTTAENPNASMRLVHDLVPLQISKISPKHNWEFRYVTNGLVNAAATDQLSLRFRVFAQSRKADHDDIAQWSTRQLLRQYAYTRFRMGRENPEAYGKIVDVYLCFGGEPGGEQLFDLDSGDLDSNNRPRKANTIYIYQVNEIQDPFQLCRELAHEFGHAVLPGVGPFEGPEDWANGDLGERVFLNWMFEDRKNNRFAPEDMVNASMSRLTSYVNTRIVPEVSFVARNSPDPELLKKRSPIGFQHYVSVGTYASVVLPPKKFNRALDLAGSDPAALSKSILEVADEVTDWTFNVPDYLKGQAIYLPYPPSRIGGGKVIGKKNGYTKVQVLGKPLTIKKQS